MVKDIRNSLAALLIFTLAIFTLGCKSTNYEFGDISAVYCSSTNPEFRAQLKLTLSEQGISIGVDYCTAHGLVDALLLTPLKNKG